MSDEKVATSQSNADPASAVQPDSDGAQRGVVSRSSTQTSVVSSRGPPSGPPPKHALEAAKQLKQDMEQGLVKIEAVEDESGQRRTVVTEVEQPGPEQRPRKGSAGRRDTVAVDASNLSPQAAADLATALHKNDVDAEANDQADNQGQKGKGNGQDERTRYGGQNIFEHLFFRYLTPLVDLSASRPLEMGDLLPLEPVDTAQVQTNTFERVFLAEKESCDKYNAQLDAESGEDGFEPIAGDEEAKKPAKTQKEKKLPLLEIVFVKMQPWLFIWAAMLEVIWKGALFAGPILVEDIVDALVKDSQCDIDASLCQSDGTKVGLFLAIFLSSVVAAIAENQQNAFLHFVGVHLQACIAGSVYKKALRLSSRSRQTAGMGYIMNMTGQDTQKIYYLVSLINTIWSAPIQMIIIIALIWRLLDWASALPAAGVLLICLYIMQGVNDRILSLEMRKMIVQDQRVKVLNETLQGIRVVKLYAWEESLAKRVRDLREKELEIVYQLALNRAMLFVAFLGTPMMMAIVAFTIFAARGGQLTAPVVFGTIALINLIRLPLIVLPIMLTNLASARVSMRRIRDFLIMEEAEGAASDDRVPVGSVVLEKGNFAWPDPPVMAHDDVSKTPSQWQKGVERVLSVRERKMEMQRLQREAELLQEEIIAAAAAAKEADKDGAPSVTETATDSGTGSGSDSADKSEKDTTATANGGDKTAPAGAYTLRDINLDIRAGEHIQIVGSVGCGKSSLLQAILGQMEPTRDPSILQESGKGLRMVNGRIAYVPQTAWMRNQSLKENICFGRPFDKAKYEKIIRICSLGPDRDALPNGDETEIGEMGINLSGGQKQRVSLARAVYSDSDIYLLDDVLSAVDAHVGRQIFNRVIRKELRHKTVILVTHQLQYLDSADRVAIMDKGRIVSIAHFRELKEELKERGLVVPETKEAETPIADIGTPSADGDGDEEHKSEQKSNDTLSLPPAPRQTRSVSDASAVSGATDADEAGDAEDPSSEKKDANAGGGVDAGAVPGAIYKFYGLAAGGWPFLVIMLTLYSASQGTLLFSDWWLSHWSEDVSANPSVSADFYLRVYGGVSAICVFFLILRVMVYARGSQLAAQQIHDGLLGVTVKAEMAYFETTPVGKLMDVFSKDQTFIDNFIPMMADQVLTMFFNVVGNLIIISFILPAFLIAWLVLGILFRYVQQRYLRASRSIYRLWFASMGPVYSFLGESIMGTSSILAYGLEEAYVQQMCDRLDATNNAFLHTQMLTRWMATRVSLLGSCIVGVAAGLVWMEETGGVADSPSAKALALTFSVNVTGIMALMVMVAAFLENFMTSVQRVYNLMDIPQETVGGRDIPATTKWPDQADVEFKNVSFVYNADGPKRLDNLSFRIPAGSKVGIVGRTGAGKTTITAALFRLRELFEGHMIIDGEDLSELSLRSLRSKLAIIPQDPVCFHGTLRFNVDPFYEFTDMQVWNALERVRLEPTVRQLDGQLNGEILPNGSNLSLGQRQLLCFARALLRDSNFLFMDEATASVDVATDALIQKMIRTEFRHCTVITIAHRLNTIQDSDIIIGLDAGKLVEMGSPEELQADKNSYYSGLLRELEKSKNSGKRPDAGEKDESAARAGEASVSKQ